MNPYLLWLIYILMAFLIKLVDLALMLIGLAVVPVAIKKNWPKWAWLWNNDDHPIDGGGFWRKKCGASFWCKYQWFALRNPTFNFSKYVLGIKFRHYEHYGDTGVGDTRGAGSYWCYVPDTPFFEYYLIHKWSATHCLRVRIGWKIYGKSEGDMCQFCFVVSPWHT